MRCPKCGKDNIDSMKKCYYCGANLDSSYKENNEISHSEEPITNVREENNQPRKVNTMQEEVDQNFYSNRYKYQLCLACFFLGFLGLHDFLSGKVNRGLIKVSIFLLSPIIICIGLFMANSLGMFAVILVVGGSISAFVLLIIVVCDLFKILCDVY